MRNMRNMQCFFSRFCCFFLYLFGCFFDQTKNCSFVFVRQKTETKNITTTKPNQKTKATKQKSKNNINTNTCKCTHPWFFVFFFVAFFLCFLDCADLFLFFSSILLISRNGLSLVNIKLLPIVCILYHVVKFVCSHFFGIQFPPDRLNKQFLVQCVFVWHFYFVPSQKFFLIGTYCFARGPPMQKVDDFIIRCFQSGAKMIGCVQK